MAYVSQVNREKNLVVNLLGSNLGILVEELLVIHIAVKMVLTPVQISLPKFLTAVLVLTPKRLAEINITRGFIYAQICCFYKNS